VPRLTAHSLPVVAILAVTLLLAACGGGDAQAPVTLLTLPAAEDLPALGWTADDLAFPPDDATQVVAQGSPMSACLPTPVAAVQAVPSEVLGRAFIAEDGTSITILFVFSVRYASTDGARDLWRYIQASWDDAAASPDVSTCVVVSLLAANTGGTPSDVALSNFSHTMSEPATDTLRTVLSGTVTSSVVQANVGRPSMQLYTEYLARLHGREVVLMQLETIPDAASAPFDLLAVLDAMR